MEIPNIKLEEVKFEFTHHVEELICFVIWENLGEGIINGTKYPRTYRVTITLDNKGSYGPFITSFNCNISNSLDFLKKAINDFKTSDNGK
jgi:hypothetical protein